jgi:hypothetical protein
MPPFCESLGNMHQNCYCLLLKVHHAAVCDDAADTLTLLASTALLTIR